MIAKGKKEMIYVDMDGVVADFDKGILNYFGEPYSEKIANQFWNYTVKDIQFFDGLSPINEGLDMVREISESNDVCFMTSTGGMPHHIDIAKQKLDWLHRYGFGDKPVAFCLNTEGKGKYSYPGAVLIDDRQKVCNAWEKRGGKSFLFTRECALEISNGLCV